MHVPATAEPLYPVLFGVDLKLCIDTLISSLCRASCNKQLPHSAAVVFDQCLVGLQIRASHGFQGVRAVMVPQDFDTIKDLYDFTEEALKLSGTGRLEDLENWLSANYPERFRHLFQDPRPWVRNTLGQPALRPRINLVPVIAPVPMHNPRPKRDKKGRLTSVSLYNPHCLVLYCS